MELTRHGRGLREQRSLKFVYDTNKMPISFDICWALSWADIQRNREGYDSLDVTIVNLDPCFVHSMPEGHPDYVSSEELRWRVNEIIVPITMMHKNVACVSVCEKESFFAKQYVLPLSSSCRDMILYPKTLPEMYRTVLSDDRGPVGFSARGEGRRALECLLATENLQNIVSITIRQNDGGIQRNSLIDQWNNFAKAIQAHGYRPIFIPDTTRWFVNEDYAAPSFPAIALNMRLRMALYELATVNLFVNSGPAALCCLTPGLPYLTFKILAAGEVLASELVISDLGFEIGATPPFATWGQKWVWEDDRDEVILREFTEFCRAADSRLRATW